MIVFGVTVGIEGKNGDAIAGGCAQLAQAVGQLCHALAMFSQLRLRVPMIVALAFGRVSAAVHELREIGHLAPHFSASWI